MNSSGVGLEDDDQVAALDGLAQVGDHGEAVRAVAVVVAGVDAHAGVGRLGHVHRHVRALDEGPRIVAVFGGEGDADADACVEP
jgi:uncharacterized membrane protein